MSIFDGWFSRKLPMMKKPKKDYITAVERILKHEGGYVDHPHDKGGKTNLGITETVARAHGFTGDMRQLTRDFAIDVYKKSYWDAVDAGDFHFAIGFQLFDACINHGQRNAIRLLQRAVGVTADGVMGPVTRHAVKSVSPATVVMLFNAERLRFYTNLSNWRTFGAGWSRRIADNLVYGEQDAD